MKRTIISTLVAFAITFAICSLDVQCVAVDTYIKDEYQQYIIEISEQYNVCPELIMAMVEQESSGRADAENNGCKGLMQVYEKYHTDRIKRLGVKDLYDPYSNLLVGIDYLMELAEEYEDIGLVLDIYNGNSKAMQNAENGVLSEYAAKILDRAEVLERIHGK